MGTRIWKFCFVISKYLQLHAILHDAAAAVRTHSGEGSGYCQMIRRGPKIMFVWSRDWTTLLPLRKSLSALHFQIYASIDF